MAAFNPSEQPPQVDVSSARVQLATEFVARRLRFSEADALARLVQESETTGRSLEDIAIDVICRVSPLDP
jgi:hypothetical protein